MASKKSKKNQENLLFLFMGLIIIGLLIAGLFLFQKQFSTLFAEQKANSEAMTAQLPLANISSETQTITKEEEYIPQEDVQNLHIYYGVKGKDKLESENKRVRKNSLRIGQARQIVNSLLDLPTNERLYRILPENLTLRGLYYDSGLFIIDFSREFNKIYSYGANEQVLAIYSIVNSITELDPKAKVRFLVNGTEPEGDEGHLDLSMQLSRLESLIEK